MFDRHFKYDGLFTFFYETIWIIQYFVFLACLKIEISCRSVYFLFGFFCACTFFNVDMTSNSDQKTYLNSIWSTTSLEYPLDVHDIEWSLIESLRIDSCFFIKWCNDSETISEYNITIWSVHFFNLIYYDLDILIKDIKSPDNNIPPEFCMPIECYM